MLNPEDICWIETLVMPGACPGALTFKDGLFDSVTAVVPTLTLPILNARVPATVPVCRESAALVCEAGIWKSTVHVPAPQTPPAKAIVGSAGSDAPGVNWSVSTPDRSCGYGAAMDTVKDICWAGEMVFGSPETMKATGGPTVKGKAPLEPPGVVTVMAVAPKAALAAIVRVAVTSVALTTTMLPAVTPALETAMLAPETKLVPVNVIATLEPCGALDALRDVIVGAGGFTVKVTGALVAPATVTVTLALPSAAAAAILKVAVI